jgi:hypothetical protein
VDGLYLNLPGKAVRVCEVIRLASRGHGLAGGTSQRLHPRPQAKLRYPRHCRAAAPQIVQRVIIDLEFIMVRQAFVQTHPPPAPVLAAVARKAAMVLLGYARAQRKAQRAAVKAPMREFGTVRLAGQTFGAVYEDGILIAVIPDVERM